MNDANRHEDREGTAVDDVRRIRERLSREAGNDPKKLAEASMAWFEQHGKELGLTLVQPPPLDRVRPDGTTG